MSIVPLDHVVGEALERWGLRVRESHRPDCVNDHGQRGGCKRSFVDQTHCVEPLNGLLDALPLCLLHEHRAEHDFPAPVAGKDWPPVRLIPVVPMQAVVHIEERIGEC